MGPPTWMHQQYTTPPSGLLHGRRAQAVCRGLDRLTHRPPHFLVYLILYSTVLWIPGETSLGV